ncbi:tetratricopeptide repeat protein [Chelativorans salis]|uniref:Sel1 repeat family protein n=1 Tax=Chelativorans salis TaxID=2978478 RepID=A0ABT2LWU2_9HYPH|nr:tetratricopeptide repeat protein [Chelativorans sp. EGI FJ00035]MCT7377853.1 sel1 repeat family protein [Chelativorans sp. EGI FJ00035]
MQRDIRKITTTPIAALAVAVLMATTAITAPAQAAQVQENAKEAKAASAGQAGDAAVSSAAARTLRLIEQARGELAKKDVDGADRKLGKALGLLDLAQSSLPGRTMKDKAWTTHHGTHVYREVDLPLNTTRRLVIEAQEALRGNDIDAAEAALTAAEDNAVYLSVTVQEPLVKAHQSLWRAAKEYAAGAFGAAKSDLDQAIGYLNHAGQNMNEETHKAAQALSDQAQSLKADMETKSSDVPSRLDELWQRAKAVSERSMDYLAAGLQRAATQSDMKADLIEAKLHLSYAQIARFTTHDPQQAAEELGLALSYMDRADDRAPEAQATKILALRNSIEKVAAEPPAGQKESQFSDLRGELGRIIEARAGSEDDTVNGGIAALTAQNYDVALQILKPLAEADNAEAAFWLGDVYEEGLGVPKDVDTALTWYTKAAEGGWTAADSRLGQLYFNGTETLQDFAKAHKWLERAAHEGDSTAQQNLGELYANGWGVKKDPIWAYVWYEIAAREGNYEAAQLRDTLVKTMSEKDIAEAQILTPQVVSDVLHQASAG